jgi:hypothetical protein
LHPNHADQRFPARFRIRARRSLGLPGPGCAVTPRGHSAPHARAHPARCTLPVPVGRACPWPSCGLAWLTTASRWPLRPSVAPAARRIRLARPRWHGHGCARTCKAMPAIARLSWRFPHPSIQLHITTRHDPLLIVTPGIASMGCHLAPLAPARRRRRDRSGLATPCHARYAAPPVSSTAPRARFATNRSRPP